MLPEYTRYLTRLNLKSICPKQVIAAHAKSKGPIWNTLPPKASWTRMGYTLRVADRIALEMNVHEVEVVSAYRCPAYNAHCEGAKSRSWHQANVAVDVKFPVRASMVTATAGNLRRRGLFKGGVGGYWDFTHIDSRGENMGWCFFRRPHLRAATTLSTGSPIAFSKLPRIPDTIRSPHS